MESTLTIRRARIEDLILDPANARTHGSENLAAIEGSLRRFGQAEPLVIQASTQRVIGGNGRLAVMRQLGWAECDVVELDVDDLTATSLGIALNRTSELAAWDEGALAKLLASLRDQQALDGTGYSPEQVDALIAAALAEERSGLEDPGPGEPPEHPASRPGDLWLIGDHKLLCGDSLNAEHMARLMNGETAMLLATDPPYLVDYDGMNHPAEHHRRAGRKDPPGGELGNRRWDQYIDQDSSVAFFTDYLRVALAHCIERVPIWQWHATRRQVLVEAAWEANDLLVHQTVIWVKERGVLTRSHMLWRHEPAFYGWRKGMMPEKDRRPPTNATTVWEISQQGESDGSHPTIKPLEIFLRPIEWHTKPGEVVLEPFSGSGTQIIAAERLARRCRAMELSPAFVDVAVTRWQGATGKQAVLDGAELTFEQVAADRAQSECQAQPAA